MESVSGKELAMIEIKINPGQERVLNLKCYKN
jgi:hypothetical protein